MSIQITLTFPTIESAIAALRDIPSGVANAPAAEKPAKVEKVAKVEKAVEDPKPTATPVATTTASPTVSTASSTKPADSCDYPTLQKAVFALANKSRDAATAVAASLGVKTFKELDADKWGEALVAVKAKLAELEAA